MGLPQTVQLISAGSLADKLVIVKLNLPSFSDAVAVRLGIPASSPIIRVSSRIPNSSAFGNSTTNFPIVYAASKPIQVHTPGKIAAISAGGMHSVFLNEDGTVWACGYNTGRQLGSNQVFNEVRDVPVQVGGLSKVKAISAGGGFSLALKKDGTVWAWGGNVNGELGIGSFAADSKLVSLDYNIEPVEVSLLQDVVEISAGGTHAMAVTSDGSIWAWGGNDEGQLGDFIDNKRCVPQKIL